MERQTIHHSNIQTQTRNDRRHSTTLYQECENIAADKDSCQPGGANGTITFTVCRLNDSGENHVDCCCEEGWTKEED